MNTYNQNITAYKGKSKNLGLVLFILALGLIVSLAVINEVSAAYGLDVRIKQVKTVDSPAVYYLDHKLGVKKAYVSSAAYLAYGNKWPDIKIISQAELNKWPDLKLVKTHGDKNIYYIKGNQKALIKSPADFRNFNFNYGQVATIKKQDWLSYQTVDYATVGLIRPNTEIAVKNGGGNPGILNVELDPANLRSALMPVGSRQNLAGIFNFKTLNKPAEIKQLNFTLAGVFKTEAIEKIYLTNESGYVLAEAAGLNGRQALFNFDYQPILIAAGEIKKIKVYLDLKSWSEDFTNHYLKVSLNGYNDIKANLQVNGNFPLSAGELRFAIGSLVGKIKIEELSLNSANKLIIGVNENVIAKFKISEASGQESAFIKKIVLTNAGTARSNELANLKLKDTSNNLLAQANGMENEKVIFNLSNFKLGKGEDKIVLLLADAVGGEDAATGGKTVNFNVKEINSSGADYGYGLDFSQTDINETKTINREPISVLSADLKQSQRIFSRQSGVIVGNFQARNGNQKVRLVSIDVILNKSARAPLLSETIYLVNHESGEVYSSGDGSKLLTGVNLSFNGVALEPRQELGFSLITNLPGDYSSGDKYQIVIKKITYAYGNDSFFEDSLNLSGAFLTATKSSLYLYPNNDLNIDRSYIKGQKDVKIAGFIMEAAAGDNLNISQITLTKSGGTSGSVLYENGFSNLRLYIGGSRAGNIIERPAASTYTFDNFSYRFNAGDRAELILYADTERDLKASETELIVLSLAANSAASGVASSISGLKSVSRKAYFGENSAEIKTLNGGAFTPDVKDNNVGRFAISNNGAEDIRLDSLTIFTTNDGFSSSLGFSDLTIVEASKTQRIGGISRPVAGANRISLSGYAIKPSQTAEFTIRVSADKLTPTQGLEIYLSELLAYGRKSGLKTIVSGDPTQKAAVNCASINLEDNNEGDKIKLSWPVDSMRINYKFKDANYPFRSAGEHDGIDIDVDQSSPAKAAANGVIVELANNQNAQYNYLIIQHEQGLKTIYGHLSAINVKLGDIVESGQVIGLSGGLPGSIGSGPNTNGPHLHFGVSKDDKFVDPLGWLK